MKCISKIGPMYLLKIVSVTVNQAMGNRDSIEVYTINFGDCRLAVTAYHSFVLIDESKKSSNELVPGDRIWVDLSAFMADGSFSNKIVSNRLAD